MDPISMDTATSPTNPDPRSPRPPPSAASPPRQRATHRGIRARRATTTGVVARAYQLPCGQAHEARRRRGDGAFASSWPTGGESRRRPRSRFRRDGAVRGEVGGGRPLTVPASSDDKGSQPHADSEVGGAAVRVAVGVRPPRSSVGAGSVASSCCRGSQCQPQPSGLTIFIFYLF